MPVTQRYQNYFYNAKKLYEFRIKVANVDITNKAVMEAIKNALNAYEVESISAPKRLPIQEHKDFGNLGPCEVYVVDVAVNYPTICEQVRQLVINRAMVPNNCVCVETLNQAEQEDQVNATILEQGADGPIIENPELKDAPGGQEIAGQKRVDSLLKDLAKRPQMSRAYDIDGTDTTIGGDKQSSYGKTTNDVPMGNDSPIDSKHQNKIYIRATKDLK
jgi:hypothetical protein